METNHTMFERAGLSYKWPALFPLIYKMKIRDPEVPHHVGEQQEGENRIESPLVTMEATVVSRRQRGRWTTAADQPRGTACLSKPPETPALRVTALKQTPERSSIRCGSRGRAPTRLCDIFGVAGTFDKL